MRMRRESGFHRRQSGSGANRYDLRRNRGRGCAQTQAGARQRGLGEAAIAEFYSRIDEFIDPDEPVLVLFEDSDVRRITALVRGNVHLLST